MYLGTDRRLGSATSVSSATASGATAGAAFGPIGAAVGAAIAGVVSLLTSVFSIGHADDYIGQQDGVVAQQVMDPILQELLGVGSISATDMENSTSIMQVLSAVNSGHMLTNPTRAAQLLQFGDQSLAQWCQTLTQYGGGRWPCHSYVQGQSGAGTYFYGRWNELRPALVTMANYQPPAAPASANPVTAAAGWFSSFTTLGGMQIPNGALAAGAVLGLLALVQN